MIRSTEGSRWAREEFGAAEMGDARRRRRLLLMAARVAEQPSGKVSDVFRSGSELQGAYDFLESAHVRVSSLEEAMGAACVERCAKEDVVFVAVDGTTLSLVDRAKKKFGSVGGRRGGDGTGLKCVTALAMDSSGVPMGLGAQRHWARAHRPPTPRRQQKRECRQRPREQRETRHWIDVISSTAKRFEGMTTKCWFVLDREGDAQDILSALLETKHLFTVRASHDRAVDPRLEGWDRRPKHGLPAGKRPELLRSVMARQPILGHYEVELPANHARSARRARLAVRAHSLSLRFRVGRGRVIRLQHVNVVWVREERQQGEAPLDWLLLTNHPCSTFKAARQVIASYTHRWRIEEMHKTWKSGVCGVEHGQLRSVDTMMKWATLLLAVAIRVENLKLLARNEPDLPASEVLSTYEIKAILVLKRRYKSRTEVIPDGIPTVAQATRWIADLGGYTGKSSGGPPGTITIGRGLEDVRTAAAVLEQLDLEKG